MINKLLKKLRCGCISAGEVDYINGADKLPPPLSKEEEAKTLLMLDSDFDKAREILIVHNLRLVVYIAKKFESTGIGIEDLISIGTIGLIKAVNTFSTEKNIKLATYASRCIENEILMYFRSKKKTAGDISINEHIDEDKDGNALLLSDIISEDDRIIETIAGKISTEAMLKAINEDLDEREKTVIVLRYGLKNPPLTQKETAARLGISRSYVSRIEKKALTVLREKLSKYM